MIGESQKKGWDVTVSKQYLPQNILFYGTSHGLSCTVYVERHEQGSVHKGT